MGLSALFPEVYAPWLSSRLAGTVVESLATCDSCAMVQPQGLTRDPGPFEAHLKCCTYFPFVPNFGLGAMLKEKSPELDLRLRTASVQGLLLPLGLHMSSERQNRIDEYGQEGFGRQSELLCPFFDTSQQACSVWKHRPGVCTTYFCKSDRGAKGLEFWSDLENYLNHFEWALATEVFYRLGMGEEEREMCKAVISTEEPGEERLYFSRAAWKEWYDRKEEFLIACHDGALKIGPEELKPLLGEDYLALEESLRNRV